MSVISSQMGRSAAPIEEPSIPEDDSIFLTPDQIKSMSDEQIQATLNKLNALRSTPKTARAAKVSATGEKLPPKRKEQEIY